MEISYHPNPVETSHITLSSEVAELVELLAKNAHDVWALHRIRQGWTYGQEKSVEFKRHPCLVEYDALPEPEKEIDRSVVAGTIKALLAMGYSISRQPSG
jgi:ryanodine receptor 2